MRISLEYFLEVAQPWILSQHTVTFPVQSETLALQEARLAGLETPLPVP